MGIVCPSDWKKVNVSAKCKMDKSPTVHKFPGIFSSRPNGIFSNQVEHVDVMGVICPSDWNRVNQFMYQTNVSGNKSPLSPFVPPELSGKILLI